MFFLSHRCILKSGSGEVAVSCLTKEGPGPVEPVHLRVCSSLDTGPHPEAALQFLAFLVGDTPLLFWGSGWRGRVVDRGNCG